MVGVGLDRNAAGQQEHYLVPRHETDEVLGACRTWTAPKVVMMLENSTSQDYCPAQGLGLNVLSAGLRV